MNTPVQKQPLWREYWYVILFIIAFIALAVSYILRAITPPTNQPNTWNNLTPGYSKLDDVTQNLGQPIGQEQTPFGERLLYESNYPTLPNSVIVDPENTVQFIKQYLPLDGFEALETYTSQYGEPDFVLIDEEAGETFRAHVFLTEGLVLIAHVADNSVQQKWYFTPVNAEIFLQSWGTNLTDQPEGPEEFTPID